MTRLPRMLGFQAAGRGPDRRAAIPSSTPRRSRPPSASGARRRGTAPSAAAARVGWRHRTPSPTTRSWTPTASWPRPSRCSASRRRPRRSPACSRSACPTGSTVVCVLTGHGLKDPDIAIGQIAVPTAVDADVRRHPGRARSVASAGMPRSGCCTDVDPGIMEDRRSPIRAQVPPSSAVRCWQGGGPEAGIGDVSPCRWLCPRPRLLPSIADGVRGPRARPEHAWRDPGPPDWLRRADQSEAPIRSMADTHQPLTITRDKRTR